MIKSIYYLPGHGGQLETGLGEALLLRGFNVTGRATIGVFRETPFLNQIAIIADDLRSHFWKHESMVIANSFGAYLLLHALAGLPPYVGKALLLSPIVGEFSTEDATTNFAPPYSRKLLRLAGEGTYPPPLNCQIHVGQLDWQSNPSNVLRLADLLGIKVSVVPDEGHRLNKRYVSNILDQWLPN